MATESYFGQCKCCLKDTYLKNMWYEGNEQEVYGQMLVDCFAVDWVVYGDMQDDKICEACISKLRVAVNFKNQVLMSQEKCLKTSIIKEENDDTEEVEEESGEEQEESLNVNSEPKTYEDVEFLEEEVLDEETNDDDSQDSEPVQKKPKWPKKRPPYERYKTYRQYTEEDLKNAVEAVRAKEMSIVKAAETYKIPRKSISKRLYDDTERVDIFNAKELIKAIRAVLKHTNATPFRIKIKSFCCFFCPCNTPGFEDPEDLRMHTLAEHEDKVVQIEFAIRPHHMNQMIRFDITDLTCDCDEEVTWPTMLEHLETRHNVEDIRDAWKKIVPYKLTTSPTQEITCALCDFTACFSKLDTHMNIHFENYICGDCGKPFVTAQRLKSHDFYHELGEYRCDVCDQVFPNQKSRRQHVDVVHQRKLSFKCTVCPERFPNNQSKLNHLKTEHQDMLETKGRMCKYCNKSFWAKDYWRHMRREHSHFCCYKCGRKFENQKTLDKHVCKGGEVNKYRCETCFKLFFSEEAVVTHKESCGH